MKILYGIQGTGNGHIARSKEIIKNLVHFADVDVLLSGTQYEIKLPFGVKYRYAGIQIAFGQKGGIDYWKTLSYLRFLESIKNILALPNIYDIVVSDFEPISAYFALIRGVPSIAISNQAALLQTGVPLPKQRNWLLEHIIKCYAPCEKSIGIHFQKYNANIVEPIIREDIREAYARYQSSHDDHYLVYLPAFHHEHLLPIFLGTDVKWTIFSKKYIGDPIIQSNVTLYPAGHAAFTEKLMLCKGIISNAGFETSSEALFLGKKILVMPMNGQYEQKCNAVALKELGATVCPASLKALKQILPQWLSKSENNARIAYDDPIPKIIDQIMKIAK